MKKIILFWLITISFTAYAQFPFQKTWATYYFGGGAVVSSSKIDSENNIIVVGGVRLVENFGFYNSFTSPNCYQPNISPNNNSSTRELFLAKFTPSGSLIWATFYGGNGNESSYCLEIDSDNNILISGNTSSTSGIATAGAYIQSYTNGIDGFLSKFSSDGVLLWGTYLHDMIRGMAVNTNNEIYLFGADSVNNNLGTSGAYIENFEAYVGANPSNSNINAFILKFDSNGNKLVGTYLGRCSYPSYRNIRVDTVGNIVVSYVVEPDNGFYGYPTSFQPTCQGSGSLVLSKYNPNLTQRIWSTYFGGSNNTSCIFGALSIDPENNDIYMIGNTNSTDVISTPNTHQASLFNSTDAFLNKFDANGNRIWGTYFGGESNFDYIRDVSITDKEVYFAGGTISATNIATNGAYETVKTSPAGSYNGYFASMNKNTGTINWCSYFGGNGDINKILPKDGYFYLVGSTLTTTGITTPNSLQPNFAIAPNSTQQTPGYNIFLARFDPNPLATNIFETQSLQLSPNPNNGSFELKGNLENQENLNLTVFDNLGRTVARQKISVIDNQVNQRFNFEDILKSGIYFAKLMSENQVLETFKILVE